MPLLRAQRGSPSAPCPGRRRPCSRAVASAPARSAQPTQAYRLSALLPAASLSSLMPQQQRRQASTTTAATYRSAATSAPPAAAGGGPLQPAAQAAGLRFRRSPQRMTPLERAAAIAVKALAEADAPPGAAGNSGDADADAARGAGGGGLNTLPPANVLGEARAIRVRGRVVVQVGGRKGGRCAQAPWPAPPPPLPACAWAPVRLEAAIRFCSPTRPTPSPPHLTPTHHTPPPLLLPPTRPSAPHPLTALPP